MLNTSSILWRVILACLLVSSLIPDAALTPTPPMGNLLESDPTTTPEETTVDPFRFLILCAPGSERRNTCEKCTKVTKDPNTYKMCCENINEVQSWCRTFLDYTIPPRIVG